MSCCAMRGSTASPLGRPSAKISCAAPVVSASGWYPLYLSLGDAYLRLGDPRQAIESFDYGRVLNPATAFFEDMSNAWTVSGDPRKAAIVLLEGVIVDPSNSRLASELVELYRAAAPGSCALVNDRGAELPAGA